MNNITQYNKDLSKFIYKKSKLYTQASQSIRATRNTYGTKDRFSLFFLDFFLFATYDLEKMRNSQERGKKIYYLYFASLPSFYRMTFLRLNASFFCLVACNVYRQT